MSYIPAPKWVDSSKVDGKNNATNNETQQPVDATSKLGLREVRMDEERSDEL